MADSYVDQKGDVIEYDNCLIKCQERDLGDCVTCSTCGAPVGKYSPDCDECCECVERNT